MSDGSAIRVLPSEKLAAPGASRTDIPGTLRQQARTGTVSEPAIQHVEVGGADVLLTRLPTGEPVAFGPACPHQGTPLDRASIFEGKLRCPKHQYLYDPKTGENVFPRCDASPGALWKLKPGYLRTYRVQEHDGWIWISPSPNPSPPSYDPAAELPPVSQDRARDEGRPASGLRDVHGTLEHLPESFRLPQAGEREIELPTTPLPGHVWLCEIEGSCIEILGQVFDERKDVHRLKIAALAPGEATVRCRYSKPWRKDCREIRTYVVTVPSR